MYRACCYKQVSKQLKKIKEIKVNKNIKKNSAQFLALC